MLSDGGCWKVLVGVEGEEAEGCEGCKDCNDCNGPDGRGGKDGDRVAAEGGLDVVGWEVSGAELSGRS